MAQGESSRKPIRGYANRLRMLIGRVDRMTEVLDTVALDALREMVNSIATLELRASDKVV